MCQYKNVSPLFTVYCDVRDEQHHCGCNQELGSVSDVYSLCILYIHTAHQCKKGKSERPFVYNIKMPDNWNNICQYYPDKLASRQCIFI